MTAPRDEDKPPPQCEYGRPQCRTYPARLYPCGWRCDTHQPARTHRRTAP